MLYSYGTDEDFELSDEWKAEIARRVKEIEDGTANADVGRSESKSGTAAQWRPLGLS